jgi:ABC-type branched-subunit amino acid transport system substrate-binding protein
MDWRKELSETFGIPKEKIEHYKYNKNDLPVFQRHAIYFVNDKGIKRYFGIISDKVEEL